MSAKAITRTVTRTLKRLLPAVAAKSVKKRTQPQKGKRRRTTPSPVMSNYCACLVDPFCCPPTYVPIPSPEGSFLGRAIYRASLSANADGSFAVFVAPSLTVGGAGSIRYNNSGAGGNTWSTAAFTNQAALVDASLTCRVVSGGVRVITQIPASSAPGFIYTGSLPGLNVNGLVTTTPNSIVAWPLMKASLANRGGYALTRPLDLDSFDFTANMWRLDASTTPDWSFPVITILGLPASSTVLVECVMNLELLPSIGATASIDAAPNSASRIPRPTVEPSHLLGIARDSLVVASGALDGYAGTQGNMAPVIAGTTTALVPGRTMYTNPPASAQSGSLMPM